MFDFDDSRLENPEVLAAAAPLLMNLASSGARVRREAAIAEAPLADLIDVDRPRAVIANGPRPGCCAPCSSRSVRCPSWPGRRWACPAGWVRSTSCC